MEVIYIHKLNPQVYHSLPSIKDQYRVVWSVGFTEQIVKIFGSPVRSSRRYFPGGLLQERVAWGYWATSLSVNRDCGCEHVLGLALVSGEHVGVV